MYIVRRVMLCIALDYPTDFVDWLVPINYWWFCRAVIAALYLWSCHCANIDICYECSIPLYYYVLDTCICHVTNKPCLTHACSCMATN